MSMGGLPATRRADVQRIQEVIERGDFDSPEEMAKAVFKVATAVVLEREWYVAVIGERLKWGYGLFPGRAAAEKACIVGPAAVFKVSPGDAFLETVYGPEEEVSRGGE